MSRLELDRFCLRYGDGPTIVDVAGSVDASVLAVLGPNGAGKSTLIAGLLGALPAASGSAPLDAADLGAMHPRERAARVAYIAQRPAFTPGYTARELVALGRAMLPRDDDAVDRAAERAGVEGLMDTPAQHLSVGQLQRVTVARAMAQLHPLDGQGVKLLLADEPLAALDPAAAAGALKLLREAADGHPLIVVAVLHDPAAAAAVADKALLLTGSGAPAAIEPAREALTTERLGDVFRTPFLLDAAGLPRPELTPRPRIAD